MTDTYFISVDLGGTNIRTALFSIPNQQIEKRIRVPTSAHRGLEPVLETILHAIQEVFPADPSLVRGIGLGAPGPLDPYRGVIICPPNLPGWNNVPLQSWLEERLNVPVRLGNDANLAALGEWKFGAGKGATDLIYLTISTGIGSGVICGGRLLLGAQGLAAELGHVNVIPDGPPCNCGGRGHLEAVASGPAIARRARESLETGRASALRDTVEGHLEKIDSIMIAQAAKNGDALSREVYQEAGTWLGRAIADSLAIFNPSIVILGGGVLNAGDLLLDPVRQAVETYALDPAYTRDLKIVTAQLGDDCGLYGAFVLLQDELAA